MDYVRGGDTLVVTKVDRLTRSTVGLWEVVKRLEAVYDRGAGLRVLNLGGEMVDTKRATGNAERATIANQGDQPLWLGAPSAPRAPTQRTAIVAIAARRLGRPVKVVATREQGFTIATFRAETPQRIQLAATRNGKLQELNHEGAEVTSRADPYAVAGTDASTRMYACPNVASNVTIVRADRATPGFV